ncbi:MAG TPA: MFS transporter [Noviherbaspirillum sp.]|jgi:MFS family permease|uniref:MFS transporter n=1 Tax=Noviherbaspirillum sp. TaxID=1926288 RepID=UPI002DDCD53E|nr:MFS transporter [Noviherbaspirillum sp.]HEV2612329.1 MFS transporter [Noviherbaspirillum sp.]
MKRSDPRSRDALFRDGNFRWLFAGSLISQLGDQFTLIALPWLALKMTGDTLVLGTVLALLGVPRALFILIGGAFVDRHSPKRVLMLSKYASTVLLGLLAALTLSGHPDLRFVYALALAIGVASAFSLPSATSILPTVMPRELLGQANGLMMGVRQLSTFAGPLLAGLLIAVFGDATAATQSRDYTGIGIGMAFAFDAASFAFSAWTLTRVRTHAAGTPSAPAQMQSMWRSVADGLRYCWGDNSLRVCFCYWAAVAFFITGPIQVAMPVLASHVGGSASAYGMLAGAYGAGTLIGMAFCGIRPGFRIGSFGTTVLIFDAAVGLLFMPLGVIGAVWHGVLLLLAIGALGGFLQVNIFTWLQRYVAPAMLGRTMALFMFIFMGIAPMSSSVTGWLMRDVTLQQLFAVSGGLLVGIVLLSFALSGMRSVVDAGTAAQGR